MRSFFVIGIILFSFCAVSGQTIEELEYELSHLRSSEKEGGKIDKARLLLEKDSLNRKAVEYICRYYSDRKIDSVGIFLSNLINKYPDLPEPFLLRADFFKFEFRGLSKEDYFNGRIRYLKGALKIDGSNSEALYGVAQEYYRDFISPFEKEEEYDISLIASDEEEQKEWEAELGRIRNEKKYSIFPHSADSALVYLYALWKVDEDKRDIIYFPIRQLECYLNKQNSSPVTENVLLRQEYCYFPPWIFVDFGENWECDNSIHYLYKAEFSKSNVEHISIQLTDLQEPCLYEQNVEKDYECYRFTWLRSFDNPISIRIENNNNRIFLYWKEGKGRGGYTPQGIKRKGKKRLSKSNWDEFIDFVKKANYDSLPNERWVPMVDGASWTLEHKTESNFKVHDTNWPDEDFEKCCLSLLKQSGIKVKKQNIY